MKFTPAGGSISLSVRQLDSGDYAKYRFEVSDTGIGMSRDFLRRIYEPYAREMRFSDRQAPGAGLDISITQSLVAWMGGEIRVESEAGKGSRFTVTLPFAAAEPDTDAPGGGGREADCPRFSLRGLRILLAEDNEINMEVTAELLRAQGAQVTQAWNGAEAVERFQSLPPNSFDAVLLDMQMPELDGCEAARRLRALPRPDAGTVPIIAVTANAFTEDVAATSAAGMDAHVSKPIDLTALSDVLKRLLASR